jgi:ABC-type Mn2+/Zn2+ transport system permease subunit
MSLLGDAISHAVLPGIALAFLLTGSVSGWPIFIGALVLGVLTSALTQAVTSLARVSEDTSLGVVFTSLFALGVIMLQAWARHSDLDADCVFYGQIDFVAADTVPFLGIEVSRPLLTLVPMLLVTLTFVVVFWKELKIVAFDPALARAMGVRVNGIHYAFMGIVAGVCVASFESVGAILVVAMLIVPPATASLLCDRLGWMIAWAVAIGATSSMLGYLLAATVNTSVAGAMAVVAGMQFFVAVLAAPRSGLVSRWLRNKALAVRIAAEDVLARLYRREEKGDKGRQTVDSGADRTIDRAARWWLRRRGLVNGNGNALALTDAGRAAARSLVRAHRLWEAYLETHFDLPLDHLHDAAERMEHFLGAELQEEIAAELADRAVDPHGKVIPPAKS